MPASVRVVVAAVVILVRVYREGAPVDFIFRRTEQHHMGHLAVPHHFADDRADGGSLLGHCHVIDVVVEHSQQLPHDIKFQPGQNAIVSKAFQFLNAGTERSILCVQLFDSLFQVDSGGAVLEICQ